MTTEAQAAGAAASDAPTATGKTAPTRVSPDENPIASMRASCRAAFCSTSTPPDNLQPKGGVTVDAAACRALGAALAGDANARRAVRRAPSLAKDSPLALPVRFATLEDEANLLALYHLLDFGSGFDAELRSSGSRRPQREALAFGVLGLHLGGRALDAEWMASFSAMDVHSVFGIDATIDVPLKADLPGITVSKPGPLAPLASALRRALNETGALLLEKQKAAEGDAREQAKCRSLGALVLALLAEGNGIMGAAGEEKGEEKQRPKQHQLTSAAFARELVETVPAFDDWGLLLFDGDDNTTAAERLTFWRRAQNLAADLARLADRPGPSPPPLPAELAFSDGAARELSAEASPAVVAALRARGLLRFSPALAAAVDAGADLGAGGGGAGGAAAAPVLQASERALRAAAVAAVDAIVEGGIGGGGNGGGAASASASAPTAPFTAREVSAWLSGQVAAAEEEKEREEEKNKGGGAGGGEDEDEEDEARPQAAAAVGGGAVDAALLLKKPVYRETTAY
jgi:hypothetical protein